METERKESRLRRRGYDEADTRRRKKRRLRGKRED